MSQHIRFWIQFVLVAFTSTKDTASPYIFKRSFVSMPIHLYVLFLLFIMSNLFYRGGVRAGSNLSILKEAKKNYMGQFIFSRGGGGWGSICLFLCQKKYTILWWLHLILWQLLYRLNKYDFSNNMSWLRWRIFFSFRWNVFSFIQINRQFSCRKKNLLWTHQLL